MKNKIIAILFPAILALGLLLHIAAGDQARSLSERRLLQQFPEMTGESIVNTGWMEAFESYLLDQFPLRDSWRSLKANVQFSVLRQMDNNGLYVQQGHIFKMVYPLNQTSAGRFAEKVNALMSAHLQHANVYCAIIPDKQQYALPQTHLALSHDELAGIVRERLDAQVRFIPLLDCLELSDYYQTDLHWKQENLADVLARLGEHMAFTAGMEGYAQNKYAPFHGGYYGQLALPVEADTLVYLTSEQIQNAIVENIEQPDKRYVYDEEALTGMDAYTVFLHGPAPLLTVTNKTASNNGRSLIIFRDSYGSSIAPLLLQAYDRITLIDLRYMSSDLLSDYVDFDVDDVLFLYGEQLVNDSALLK